MPFLRRMLVDVQAHLQDEMKGCRAWSLLPQKQLRPLFIKINTTVLKALAKALGDPVDIYADNDELWRTYFNIGSVVKGKRKEFEDFISTDGMSVSVVTSRPKLTTKEVQDYNSFEDCRIIGLDPGRKNIFTAVVHSKESMETLQAPNGENIRNEVIHWSRGRFYRECGYHKRTRLTKEWSEANPRIKEFGEKVPSSKVADLVSYLERVRFCLAYLDDLFSFYSSKRMKRLKWSTYIRRQQTYEKITKSLTGGHKRTIVAYGDASFTSSARGNVAVPTSTLRRKISSRCRVVEIDEFRTSLLCCSCHSEMKGLVVDGEEGGKGIYGVRRCINSACPRTLWNRDVNAAVNILRLFLHQVKGEGRPEPFTRNKNSTQVTLR
jgi:hypothetical protein